MFAIKSSPWILSRFSFHDTGIIGELLIPEFHTPIYTIERPWLNNARYVSCIPMGEYPLRSHSGVRWPRAIEICDVPERSVILLHPSRTVRGVKGCVGVGLEWNIDTKGADPNLSLLDCEEAFAQIMAYWEELAKLRESPTLVVRGPQNYPWNATTEAIPE